MEETYAAGLLRPRGSSVCHVISFQYLRSTGRQKCRTFVKHWEIIADRLSAAGLELGLCQPLIPMGEQSSIHRNGDRSRRDSVSDDNKLARAPLFGYRHIEMSRYQIAGSNGHAAVVVRPAIKYVPGSVVPNAHEGEVG